MDVDYIMILGDSGFREYMKINVRAPYLASKAFTQLMAPGHL